MKKQVQKFLIGIEGGGTKSNAVLSGCNGKILATAKGKATNPNTVGFENVVKVCFQLITDCCKKANCMMKEISSIVIGTAGAGNKTNQLQLKKLLKDYFAKKNIRPKILITSDAHITLEGAIGNESGIIMIAGTGSILLGKLYEPRNTKHDLQMFRVGGWGRIIGDDGSGFAIARDALKSVINSFEKKITPTQLTNAALKYLEAKTVEELPSKIASGKKDIAAFTPEIIELASQKDFQSIFVLEFHCNALIQQLHTMMNNFPDGEKIPIVLSGGLLNNDNFYSRLVKKNIADYFPNLILSEAKDAPVYGAILLAMKKLKTKK